MAPSRSSQDAPVLISGREHYDRVITAVMRAELSVWIATANLKSLMVEDVGRPSRRRGARAADYRSIVSVFDELAARGVELRMLHAQAPSQPFRAELARHPRLRAGLELRLCPRNHMKVVIVDGRLLYVGSANWTGAGLGVRGDARRNFELGLLTEDEAMLDQVQAIYDRLWRGSACAACGLRELCSAPLDRLVPGRPSSADRRGRAFVAEEQRAPGAPTPRARGRRAAREDGAPSRARR